MPSVEYSPTALVYTEQTTEITDPETGETKTVTTQTQYNPFEVRLSKWKEEPDGYHITGFVSVTEFGSKLISQSDPYTWLTENYQTGSRITSQIVNEWLTGIEAVGQQSLNPILDYGNVTAEKATVTDGVSDRFDFEIVLSGATTWDIDWLTVSFDPEA
jgi:hypothetical protein